MNFSGFLCTPIISPMISPVKPWRSKSYFAHVWWDKRTRTRIKRTLVLVRVCPKIKDYRTRAKTDVTICLVRIFDTDFSDEQNELSIWTTVPKWTKWPFLLLIKDKIIKRNDFYSEWVHLITIQWYFKIHLFYFLPFLITLKESLIDLKECLQSDSWIFQQILKLCGRKWAALPCVPLWNLCGHTW